MGIGDTQSLFEVQGSRFHPIIMAGKICISKSITIWEFLKWLFFGRTLLQNRKSFFLIPAQILPPTVLFCAYWSALIYFIEVKLNEMNELRVCVSRLYHVRLYFGIQQSRFRHLEIAIRNLQQTAYLQQEWNFAFSSSS